MCVIGFVCAEDDTQSSGNRTEIIQMCFNFTDNYVQMIGNRSALEKDNCSSDTVQKQQNAENDLMVKLGELLTKVELVKNNLQFSGSTNQVNDQLMEVVSKVSQNEFSNIKGPIFCRTKATLKT